MRVKNILRFTALILMLISIASVGTVSALWQYAQGGVESKTLSFNLNCFPWDGSDLLPEDSEEGLNHKALIENMVNASENGLNAGDSFLNDAISDRLDGSFLVPKRDTLGSMAVTQGSELEDLFDLNTNGISFLIHMVSDNEYHIYTTSVYLGERGEINSLTGKNKKPGNPTTPIGEYISPIYKTVVEYKDGKWSVVSTRVGKAKSAWSDESRRDASKNGTQIPSFDPNSWVETE